MTEEERTTPASPLLEEEMEETWEEDDEESTPFSASEVFSAFLAVDVLLFLESLSLEVVEVEVLAPDTPTAYPKPDWPAAEMTDLQDDGVVPVTRVAEPEKSQADLFLFCSL